MGLGISKTSTTIALLPTLSFPTFLSSTSSSLSTLGVTGQAIPTSSGISSIISSADPVPTPSVLTVTASIPQSPVLITITASPSVRESLTTITVFPSSTAIPAVSSSQSTLPVATVPAAASSQPTVLVPPTKQRIRGPFAPQAALLGEIPTIKLDVPITIAFLVLFMIGAATHLTIHELNGKRGHKFHLSEMVFDFCMVRTVTCTMRIVWAFRPANNSIVLAALIFENAGVVVLFAVNIIFAQRILRALHPKFGWHPVVSRSFVGILTSVVLIILWNITSLTAQFFTQDPLDLNATRGLLIFGATYTLFLCSLPILITFVAGTIPSPTSVERFGAGRFRFKIMLLNFAALVLLVGAVTRLIGAIQMHPKDDPGLIDSKLVFYTTGFMLEILIVALYAIVRIDLLFHVPDGCKGPGDYKKGSTEEDDEEEFFQSIDSKMEMRMKSNPIPPAYTNMRRAPSVGQKYAQASRKSRTRISRSSRELNTVPESPRHYIGTRDTDAVWYSVRGEDLVLNRPLRSSSFIVDPISRRTQSVSLPPIRVSNGMFI